MLVFESILLAFNERAAMIQFFVILRIVRRVDWIGLDWILQNGQMSNSGLCVL